MNKINFFIRRRIKFKNWTAFYYTVKVMCYGKATYFYMKTEIMILKVFNVLATALLTCENSEVYEQNDSSHIEMKILKWGSASAIAHLTCDNLKLYKQMHMEEVAPSLWHLHYPQILKTSDRKTKFKILISFNEPASICSSKRSESNTSDT